MTKLPKLDPKPSGRPHDWQLKKIQKVKVKAGIRPAKWKNPNFMNVAPRNQDERGTCVGQATAYSFDIMHLTLCPDDMPTDAEKATAKMDVIDSLGTRHDTLYPDSASAECFYQMSRKIGNVTYPEGSETRFSCRAWKEYGANLEIQWHTDKTGNKVWMWTAGFPYATPDGGLSKEDAAAFASTHRAEGWAMLGNEIGQATYDEICDAIYEYGFVLAAIPVYENFGSMAGGDGSFPEPAGGILGYHALCYYGYDDTTGYGGGKILLLHSWGNYCGMYGSVSRNYTYRSIPESSYFVVLDSADVKIGQEIYASLKVTVRNQAGAPLAAMISVNGVQIGISPQKFAVEKGQTYVIEAVMTGYNPAKTEVYYEGQEEKIIVLQSKAWWQKVIDWIFALFGR